MKSASHDPSLVTLSALVSVLGAYAALALIEQVRDGPWPALARLADRRRPADGISTRSMHYTGKLALRLPVPVLFDWPTVVLSLLGSILGSAAALVVLGRSRIAWATAETLSVHVVDWGRGFDPNAVLQTPALRRVLP